jgi:hypothetical protein
MDSEDVFIAILATLGFTAENMRNEIILEGVTTCNDLSSLTGPELEQVYAEARNRNRRRNLNQQITLSIPARSRLEAFRYELYLRETCGSPMTEEQLTAITGPYARDLVKQQQDKKEARENSDALPSVEIPKLTNNNWRSFRDAFLEMLSRQIGSYGIPLSYITRTNEIPQDYDADYSTLMDKLIACTQHEGPKFVADNKLVYSLLSTHLKDSEAESTVKRFSRSRNGRNCWTALRIHFESESYKSTMKTMAIANIRASEYNGPRKNFTLASLYQIHAQAHNMLEEAGLPYSESQKIQEFQSCLKEKISIEKSVSTLLSLGIDPTFENYYNTLNGQLSAIITLSEAASGTTRNSNRTINEIHTQHPARGRGRRLNRAPYDSRGRGRGRSGRGGRGRGRSNFRAKPYDRNWAPHLGPYTDEEWYSLTYAQKTRVFDLRNRSSSSQNNTTPNSRTVNNVTFDDSSIPSHVNTTNTQANQAPSLPPAPSSHPTPPPPSASVTMSRGSAGSAFRRPANQQNNQRWN